MYDDSQSLDIQSLDLMQISYEYWKTAGVEGRRIVTQNQLQVAMSMTFRRLLPKGYRDEIYEDSRDA